MAQGEEMFLEVKKLTRQMKASGVKCAAASLTSLHMLKFTIEMDLSRFVAEHKTEASNCF